ncbi:Uncharacterized protein APZ42_032991 [Daphnia magna]|uniref:PHD-type domain-containing protein n=1 Tax=Daphnia magna TaxID=35525 RepID=A0A164LIL1_9CRUS|nr:Uncharacterized protein APZ42_032991 [Daphnia magna]
MIQEEEDMEWTWTMNMEQEALQMERSVGPATVDMSEEPLSSTATYSPMRVDANHSVTDLIQTEKDDIDAEVPPIQSSESPTTNFATVTHSPMHVEADQSVTALIQNDKDDVNAEVPPIQSSKSPTTNFDSPVLIPSQVSSIRFKVQKPANRQMLFVDDVTELTKTNQLTSGHINVAQSNLKLHHPEISGLFCFTMGSLLQFPQAEVEKWMQIVQNGSKHWMLVAKGFSQPDHVLVYDSMPRIPWNNEHVLSLQKQRIKEVCEVVKRVELDCVCRRTGYELPSDEWRFVGCDGEDCEYWCHRMCAEEDSGNDDDEWLCSNCKNKNLYYITDAA